MKDKIFYIVHLFYSLFTSTVIYFGTLIITFLITNDISLIRDLAGFLLLPSLMFCVFYFNYLRSKYKHNKKLLEIEEIDRRINKSKSVENEELLTSLQRLNAKINKQLEGDNKHEQRQDNILQFKKRD